MQDNFFQKMFSSLSTIGDMTKHGQEILPQKCFLVCSGLKTQLLDTKNFEFQK